MQNLGKPLLILFLPPTLCKLAAFEMLTGMPTVFYTDHGSDFTFKHMEQVVTDLPMELIFSQVSIPRGRGKIERFFRSVDLLLLQDTQ